MEVVGGSIPLATTNFPTPVSEVPRRPFSPRSSTLARDGPGARAESFMFKFLGSAVGIIFLIGLVVVILLLKFIF
jgi:hypothetical protein